jgi:hypothetical protein
MGDRFVNRINERNKLKSKLSDIGIRNHCVILDAESGIGKSELTRKFISEIDLVPTFKIEIKQSLISSYENGYYLREIAKVIDKFSCKFSHILSMREYIQRLSSSVFRDRIYTAIKNEIQEHLIGGKIIAEYYNALTGKEDFDCSVILNSYNVEHYSIVKEYISNIFRRNNIVLNIENIQDIDVASFNDLIDAFSKSKGSFLLVEYTRKANPKYSITDIIKELEKNEISIEIENIKALDIIEVKKIIKQYPKASWQLIEHSFTNWNGNLRSVTDLLTRISYDDEFAQNLENTQINHSTFEALNSLSSDALFLLIIICEHIEPVNQFILKTIINSQYNINSIINISKVIEELICKNYINTDTDTDTNSNYQIAHDSISTLLIGNIKWKKYRLLAQQFWFDFYTNVNQEIFVAKSAKLSKILYYSSLLRKDNIILSYLDEISKEALVSHSPDRMIDYILEVRERLKNDKVTENEIDIWLIDLYYKLANSHRALKILNEIHTKNRILNLYYILVLEEVGKTEEALAVCNIELERNVGKNLNYELALRITRLMLNYVLERYEETEKEYFDLYNNKKYSSFIEYGFLLRNAELIYSNASYADSLMPIWESVQFFKSKKAYRMEAYSRMTYGVQIARTGKYKIALKQFEIANRILKGELAERHTILNNIAVVLLYQGRTNNEVSELFRQAMITVERDFDYTVIYMNYLALLDLRGENNKVLDNIPILLKSIDNRTYKNKEIIACAYYNLFIFYNKINELGLARHYKNLILSLNIPMTNLWLYRLKNKPISKTDNDYIKSTFSRCLSFISNWNMEIDNKLMHYE